MYFSAGNIYSTVLWIAKSAKQSEQRKYLKYHKNCKTRWWSRIQKKTSIILRFRSILAPFIFGKYYLKDGFNLIFSDAIGPIDPLRSFEEWTRITCVESSHKAGAANPWRWQGTKVSREDISLQRSLYHHSGFYVTTYFTKYFTTVDFTTEYHNIRVFHGSEFVAWVLYVHLSQPPFLLAMGKGEEV